MNSEATRRTLDSQADSLPGPSSGPHSGPAGIFVFKSLSGALLAYLGLSCITSKMKELASSMMAPCSSGSLDQKDLILQQGAT